MIPETCSAKSELTSLLVSSVGSFFSYVTDARSHEPQVMRLHLSACAQGVRVLALLMGISYRTLDQQK